MKPDSQAPSDLVPLLRQQLLLAQVRIMELEDVRDELAPRLEETRGLLVAAQALAEAKVDEAAHLEKTRADLQAQFEHLRHTQHVTNAALEAARADLATQRARQSALLDEIADLQSLSRQLAEAESAHRARSAGQEAALNHLRTEHAALAARIADLDASQRALKASRSWRWTAWLRSIERRFR
jgi:chromosome segregation ATPase